MWDTPLLFISLGIVAVIVFGAWFLAKDQARASDRSSIRSTAAFLVGAVWLSPCTQAPLSLHAQEQLLTQVITFKGRSLADIEAEFGPFRYHRPSTGPYYVARPWYAPVGSHFSVEIYSQSGTMFHARVDH